MKALKKSLIVAGVVGTVGMGALATGAIAGAVSMPTSSSDPMSSLVDKLASTFHLDKTKVQQVFDEQRSEMETKHQQELRTRLQALVDNGTITSAQKTAIESKLADLKKEHEANRDDFKNMTDEQRKAAMEKKRTELETWAKEQGLDLSKLQGIFRGPGGPQHP